MFIKILSLLMLFGTMAHAGNTPEAASQSAFQGVGVGSVGSQVAAVVQPMGSISGSSVINASSFTNPVTICVGGANSSISANNWYGFYYNTASGGINGQFFAPSTLTFYPQDVWVMNDATGLKTVTIGYGSARLASEGTVTNPAGYTPCLSSSIGASSQTPSPLKFTATTGTWNHFSFPLCPIPSGNFPFFGTDATGNFAIIMCGPIAK